MPLVFVKPGLAPTDPPEETILARMGRNRLGYPPGVPQIAFGLSGGFRLNVIARRSPGNPDSVALDAPGFAGHDGLEGWSRSMPT